MNRLLSILSSFAFACGGQATTSTSQESPSRESLPVAQAPAAETTVPPSTSPQPPPDPNAAADLPSAIDALAVDLYQHARNEPGNLAFSPASISLAFGMTWAGAAGDTATEMASVLHFPGASVHEDAQRLLGRWNGAHPDLTLRVVNRLFGERTFTFEAPYLALVRDRYDAPLEPLDFRGSPPAQRTYINGWVSEQTESRIDALLPEGVVTGSTRMVLVNAVYFLGEWVEAFDPRETRPTRFSTPSGSVRTRMMHQEASFRFGETADAQILEMPYRGGEYAMMVVLPKDPAGLPALESSLDVAKLTSWRSGLRERSVEVYFPRFTIAGAKLDLTTVMTSLGMRLAFSDTLANFTTMGRPPDPEQRLYISAAVHEAFVEVNEEGTEAAAATAVLVGLGAGAPPTPVVFRADHPFLFTIRDTQTNTLLFLGRVNDPTEDRP